MMTDLILIRSFGIAKWCVISVAYETELRTLDPNQLLDQAKKRNSDKDYLNFESEIQCSFPSWLISRR